MLDLIFGASLVVAAVLLLLVVASVSSWAIIAFKYNELRKADQQTRSFLRAYHEQPIESVYGAVDDWDQSPLAAVFRTGFREFAGLEQAGGIGAQQVESVIKRLGWVVTEQSQRLERGLPYLATVGSSAPFVGLFGTVVGIMNSFADIGATGSASLAVVAPGIAEALVATAVGLFAAIPAVIAYNYGTARLVNLTERLAAFSEEFADLLRRSVDSAA